MHFLVCQEPHLVIIFTNSSFSVNFGTDTYPQTLKSSIILSPFTLLLNCSSVWELLTCNRCNFNLNSRFYYVISLRSLQSCTELTRDSADISRRTNCALISAQTRLVNLCSSQKFKLNANPCWFLIIRRGNVI